MENKKCEYLGYYKESIWDDGERDVEKCVLFTDIGIWDEYCEDYCYCSDHKNCKLYKYIKELEEIKKDGLVEKVKEQSMRDKFVVTPDSFTQEQWCEMYVTVVNEYQNLKNTLKDREE